MDKPNSPQEVEPNKTPKVLDWISKNIWIFAVFFGACVFFGFLAPFVSAKPVTASWNEGGYWEFSHGDRTDFGFGMIFGQGSALVWPLLAAFIFVLVGIILSVLGMKFPWSLTAAMIVYIVAGIFFLIGASFYDYANCLHIVGGQAFWDYMKDYRSNSSSRLGGGLILSAVFAFMGALAAFSAAFDKEKMSIRDMTEIGILTAAAIVIDVFVHYVIPHIPGQAGNISIATLPLFIIALRHGPTKGFFASGLVFGLITCLSDGYGFFLYPLDYLVGFGSCAILGFFAPIIFSPKAKTYNLKGEIAIFVGVILAILFRMIGSMASSMINYGYTFQAALITNAIYVPVSGALALVILMGAYGPLLNLNRYFQSRSIKAE
ncbi:MAG: Thiamine transporter protein (Thia_YuaJ) [Tenericutes bacterium ADurb.BinA155]|jgi:thiamine transporter ThiT|nr:MAG: Thiamine transporter protein (Thia_YuaJ) [Tenericutes bacterium ADurb.BinA155]